MASYLFIVFHPSVFRTIELYLADYPYEYVDGFILEDGNCKMVYKSRTTKKAYDVYHMLKDDVAAITIWNNCSHFFEMIENEGEEVFKIWIKGNKNALINLKEQHIDGDSYFPMSWEDGVIKLLNHLRMREFLATFQ